LDHIHQRVLEILLNKLGHLLVMGLLVHGATTRGFRCRVTRAAGREKKKNSLWHPRAVLDLAHIDELLALLEDPRLDQLLLGEQANSLHLMKHWVVAGINLVPPVHIPSHKERILRREKQVGEPGIPKRERARV